jgi:hypothetical protein
MPDVDIDFETEDGVPVGIKDITPNVRTDPEFPKPGLQGQGGHQVPELSGVVTEFSNRGEIPQFAGHTLGSALVYILGTVAVFGLVPHDKLVGSGAPFATR